MREKCDARGSRVGVVGVVGVVVLVEKGETKMSHVVVVHDGPALLILLARACASSGGVCRRPQKKNVGGK